MNKNKYFWPIQITGWLLMGVFNYVVQSIGGVRFDALITNALGLGLGGILFTSLFRFFIKKYEWKKWSGKKIVVTTILSILLISIVWTFLMFIFFGLFVKEFEFTIIAFFVSIIPLGMILFIWMLIYFSYQMTMRYHFNEIEKWKLKAEIQKAELGTLKSQINPHFMFNTLNNIKALMLEDVHLARKMITNFSELLSYSLQHAEKKEVLLSDEIEVVEKYLDLVKIQYEEKLNYSLDISTDLEREYIPPMILQLLIENAIKHGISQQMNGGELFINVSNKNNNIHIQVKNTGSLSKKNTLEKSLGIGLNNIRERLKLLYNNNANLTISETSPYVIVDISIQK